MYSLLFILNIVHRIALIVLLISFSIAPLVLEVSIFINFVVLPSIFILMSISTIYIEHTLNKYMKLKITTKKSKIQKKCLIRYGICCLHH